ncbi:MAG TPA: VWA domain-containing protein, partial [Thermodesulfobacteriota bacterium]|nr:VWA domain-containing protein [Thermodesulfobacteriota bacterium]
ERARPAGGGPPQPGEGEGSTPPLLALLEADPEATERALAAAGRRARIEQVTSRVQVPYFERRMAEALGLDGFEPLLDELAERARAAGTAEAEIEERAGRLRQRRRALEARMRALIERELELNRLADPSPVPPALAEKPFDQLTEAEIELLREATARLARRLRDVRSLRLKRARRGSLDVKRTLRRNLRYGAVPVELVQRRRRVDRPRLVAVCDVSGSVGHAARFMLQLIYSLQDQFARVRSFVFVREPIEVTELFDRLPIREAVDQALRVNYYLHSDFGNTFLTLARDYLEAFDSKTTLIVLGDARNNYLDPGLEGLERIRQRARRILWLNPEQRWVWDTGDSIMATYAPLCDLVAECRNLAQLARVVDLLAVGKPRRR